MNIAHLKFLFYLFCASTCLALKPTYYPFGPQVNVSDSELVGWTRCWNATYIAQNSNNDNVTQVYANCQGGLFTLRMSTQFERAVHRARSGQPNHRYEGRGKATL